VVFIMIRWLGSQMEAQPQQQQQQQQQVTLGAINQQRQLVNSDLVTFALVGDSGKSRVKVDFCAPVELTFRHQIRGSAQSRMGQSYGDTLGVAKLDWPSSSMQPIGESKRHLETRCAYWDAAAR